MTARAPLLQAIDGALAGRSFPITAEGITLGRDPENTVRIEGPNVSRQHARVLIHNGAVWVQDAGSRNGVFVNGQRVADHKQVKAGDRIGVGEHVFEVVVHAATGPGPIPRPPAPAPTPAKPAAPGVPALLGVGLAIGALVALAAAVAWMVL